MGVAPGCRRVWRIVSLGQLEQAEIGLIDQLEANTVFSLGRGSADVFDSVAFDTPRLTEEQGGAPFSGGGQPGARMRRGTLCRRNGCRCGNHSGNRKRCRREAVNFALMAHETAPCLAE